MFSHLKATDEAGHTSDPAEKQRTIEALDAELGTPPTERAIVCVTGDHATPTYADVIHSGDPCRSCSPALEFDLTRSRASASSTAPAASWDICAGRT